MLGKLFGKTVSVMAPIAGEVVEVGQVNDPTFSEEILGKGIAIRPSGNQVVSPFNGVVTQMFDTGHAVSLTSSDGIELLIHVGLDTVALKGQHYTPHVKDGDPIEVGDLLMEFDRQAIAEAGYDTITPIVLCNSDDYRTIAMHTAPQVAEGTPIMTIKK